MIQIKPLDDSLLASTLQYWSPGSNLAIDEAMCGFSGRAKETVKIPTKPIPEGFKRWTLAQEGYFINWIWHIKDRGPLCDRVAGLKFRYHIWLDNLFNSTALSNYLYDRGIGCSGTARANSGIHQDLIDMKTQATKLKIVWGELHTRIEASGHVCSVGWMDHGRVLWLTNACDPMPRIDRLRKKPSKTSSFATVTRAPFGPQEHVKMLFVPQIVDLYNYHMNGVDRGDQMRAAAKRQRAIKGWKALFYDQVQLALCNAFFLASRAPNATPVTYLAFRRAVSAALISKGGDWGEGNQHPRLAYLNQDNLALPRYDIRSKQLHERIPRSQQVCVVCSSNKRAVVRGLRTGRRTLGEIDPNLLPKVHRATSGCKAYKVNLCVYGPCWNIHHSKLKNDRESRVAK